MSISTISQDVWDTIRTILSNDTTLSNNVNYIGGAYPQKFIDDAGGLPFIVIHKPNISETRYTFTKKTYNIEIDIECFADTAAKLKLISDAVRNALETNQSTTRNVNAMFNFTVIGEAEDFDLRNNKRIHINRMTCSYAYRGA